MRITEMESEDGRFKIALRSKANVLRKEDGWGVFYDLARLSRFKKMCWDYEPLPSRRTQKWIDNHTFTFEEAKERLAKLESEVRR